MNTNSHTSRYIAISGRGGRGRGGRGRGGRGRGGRGTGRGGSGRGVNKSNFLKFRTLLEGQSSQPPHQQHANDGDDASINTSTSINLRMSTLLPINSNTRYVPNNNKINTNSNSNNTVDDDDNRDNG